MPTCPKCIRRLRKEDVVKFIDCVVHPDGSVEEVERYLMCRQCGHVLLRKPRTVEETLVKDCLSGFKALEEMSIEELKELDREAENRFSEIYRSELKRLEQEKPHMHPSKRSEIARKIAFKRTTRWLSENYGMPWSILRAKIRALEEEVTLEDLAV